MDSLHRALELFAATSGRAERLVCVDAHRRCTGVVSLSDVFAFLCARGDVRLRRTGGGGSAPASPSAGGGAAGAVGAGGEMTD